ncbi:MAG: site-2 protease family protein [archaeon]
MKSFNIGRISGIEIELHSTFVLFIAFIVLLLALFDPINLIGSITLIVFLFTSVFFHELTHSMVSIKKGIKVKKIILLPIGGMALTENFPEKPIDEFLISVAGPLFNFAVVIVLVFIVSLLDFIPFPTQTEITGNINSALMNYPVFALMYVNLMLGTFNLLVPALPLDGGRVWRSLLSLKFGKTKATAFVAKISKLVALILFIAGIFSGGILLSVIAVFIYFASKYENDLQQMKDVLDGIDVKKITSKKIPLLKKNLSLKELFDLMEKENRFSFLLKQKNALKYIDLELMKKVKKGNWAEIKAFDASAEMHVIPDEAKAEKAMELFMATNYELIAVQKKGKISGVIERKEMQKLFEIAKAKKENSGRKQPAKAKN